MAIITERDLTPAAAYIRMSSDAQSDSPQRQRRQIEDYAQKNGYRIVRWYEDHGITGTESSSRGDYQQLLSDASSGIFKFVIVTEQSRMSREHWLQCFPQWARFHDAGVKIVSCQSGVIDFDSIAGMVTALINQFSSHDEVRKLADRTVTGRVNRALRGIQVSGTKVFAYDREVMTANGEMLKRVHFNENFPKPPGSYCVMVPSEDTKAVEAVRWAFDFVDKGGSLHAAAREFNARGLIGTKGKRFTETTIRRILTNPIYTGTMRFGHAACGKFRRATEVHEPITKPNSHMAIIDAATFASVNSLLDANAVAKTKHRSYLLSGLVFCGHCGCRMRACTNKKYKSIQYCCPHVMSGGRRSNCPVGPAYDGSRLEKAVIAMWCEAFLRPDVTGQIRQVNSTEKPAYEQQQLRAIRDQIEKAERNLALASDLDPDDALIAMKATAGVLKGLRKEETALADKVAQMSRKLADLPQDIQGAIAELADQREFLKQWPDLKPKAYAALMRPLMVALKNTISKITLWTEREAIPSVKGTPVMRRRRGLLEFHPEALPVPDAILTDEQLAHPFRRQYRAMAQHLKEAGRAMSVSELTKSFGRDQQCVIRYLKLCRHEGTVERVEGGWKAVC